MVCGILKRSLNPESDLGARAIPVKEIFQVFPDLRAQQGAFHSGDLRWRSSLPSEVSGIHPAPFPPERIWNVPFPRKQFFTGRKALLKRLHTQLRTGQTAALGQTISGLGGIGKTQLAVEYAYRHQEEYRAVLWARAETTESLTASYTEIARLLNLPRKDAQEQEGTVQSVKDWLSHQQNWLLILDNADEPDVLIPFLPPKVGGHLIVTTRAADLSALGLGFEHALTVQKFTKQQDVPFLLRRAGLTRVSTQDRKYARLIAYELDGLPLALNQAGVYLATTGCGLGSYLELYQQQRATLFGEHNEKDREYPRSVSKTLLLSFARVEQRNPAAADLLRLCAFLAPDAIPEELFTKGGGGKLGDVLAPVVADAYQFNQAFADVRAYSLLTRSPQSRTFTVHRVVQAVLRDSMTTEMQQQWMQRAVLAVNAAFPASEHKTWPLCERLLPHALMAARNSEQFPFVSAEAGHLLYETALYLQDRARYQEAESLYQRALSIREQWLGPDHLDVAVTLNGLARLYYDQSKYAEAVPLYQRARVIQEQQLGSEHPEVARTLIGLAILSQEQGKYAEAEQLYLRAQRIQEQQLGPDHLDVALTLHGLANLYNRQSKYGEAESLYQRALHIREQQLGLEHPDVALELQGLAVLSQRWGKHEAAERFHKRALHIWEQQLGPEHPHVAYALSNLAEVYREQNQYLKAEPLLQRALQILAQQFGPTHHGVAYPLSNLANLSRDLGKFEQAESFYHRALLICEQQLGPDNLDVAELLSDLAELYVRQGKDEQVEPLLRRALAIYEQQLGPEHPNTQAIRAKLLLVFQ
jgi:tetratricopeptide (TPR) repeat protein